jgi:hypothetical protein
MAADDAILAKALNVARSATYHSARRGAGGYVLVGEAVQALADAGLLADPAKTETLGLSHALLLNGYRGYADQVNAMARRIREQDEQLALALDTLGAIWLYVNWRYVSKQLTTEQKELWADAVDEFGNPANTEPKAERWWRDGAS